MNAFQKISAKFLGLCILFASISLSAQNPGKEMNFADHRPAPCYKWKKMGNTSIFQGNKKEKKYFEGWYFKMVAADGSSILSVIPGISLSADGKEQHAFIQLIDGSTAETSYHAFPIEDFFFSTKEFAIRIGNNYFSSDSLVLQINTPDANVSGTINMSNQVEYKTKGLIKPGIMGWYRFVPFMECYHGVVSLSHQLKGRLMVNNKVFNFDEGKGYIEKDWGSSMPSSWIWMQSNHFNEPDASFMLSVANIPWLGKSFTGFLGFFYLRGVQYHFATYRRSKLSLDVLDDNSLKIVIQNPGNTLVVNARSNKAGLLKAPVEGAMDRRIAESIDANISIEMLDKKGRLVFSDSSAISGLELVGDFQLLSGFHH